MRRVRSVLRYCTTFSWRAQIRRKGLYLRAFLRREDARRLAAEVERQVDRGATP